MSHGPVMLDLQGLEVTPEEKEILLHPATGGVILFSRNFQSLSQLAELVSQIHALRKPQLLVAVDQEGGRVQRFREGFSLLPPPGRIGELYRHDHERGLHAAREIAWLMAAELQAVGIDFSFAPVVDLDVGVSRVIGDRAFHRQPEIVSRLAHAWMKGCHDAGMAVVGKHFPGHGNVVADSHHDLPVDEREFAEIASQDLLPFRQMVGYGMDAVMPAHVVYPRVDKQVAGFSAFWLQQVLRRQLGFQGAIFSDDLSMTAAETGGTHAERAAAALQAGCDMVLVCNDPKAAAEVLESLEHAMHPVSQSRLARMHGHGHFDRAKLQLDNRWHQASRLIDALQPDMTIEMDLADPTSYK